MIQQPIKCIRFHTLETEASFEENKSPSCFYIQSESPQSYFGNINYFKEQLALLQNSHKGGHKKLSYRRFKFHFSSDGNS